MGVRRNIIPWICDFLQNRLQCVRLNNTLSDDVQLTAGWSPLFLILFSSWFFFVCVILVQSFSPLARPLYSYF